MSSRRQREPRKKPRNQSFEGRYIWHSAADDRQLADACVDVQAGRYLSASEALRSAADDFGLRAHRSLVLASEAWDSDLTERWVAEEPCAESALLWARVAVLRAVRAAETGDDRATALSRIALSACQQAADHAPQDPTPWVAQLSLSRFHRSFDPAPQGLLTAPSGPWRLLSHILRLDPWNREAHHRFLSIYFPRNGGKASEVWDVAAFLSQRAPSGSPLSLLPLVALVENYNPSAPLAYKMWEQPPWSTAALSIYHKWLPHVPGYRFTPVVDLSYLAHALVMARKEFEARAAFMLMGPYASRMPWSAFGAPEEQLTKARETCGLTVPGGS
ncbi:hypothetical protein RVR_7315 [Actinacidiphila reveromycinica]|uniref:Uncharacterized protein n=1 Tax=Actinacidiphila reveromycinica TaxID=659352 RepID=A0A7U3UXA3_9ACTN|nr:hypothetical protein RVR_7315 [Streptomyces sp. SN-593]